LIIRKFNQRQLSLVVPFYALAFYVCTCIKHFLLKYTKRQKIHQIAVNVHKI
jgi:hypothetical protein